MKLPLGKKGKINKTSNKIDARILIALIAIITLIVLDILLKLNLFIFKIQVLI